MRSGRSLNTTREETSGPPGRKEKNTQVEKGAVLPRGGAKLIARLFPITFDEEGSP